VFVHDSNHKGNVAEAAIAAEATKLGIAVIKPLNEHTRYDLIFDLRPRLLRVQCKWAPLRGDVIVVNLMSSRYKSSGEQIRVPYSADEIDAVAAYCEALDECFLLPIGLVADRRAVQLRIRPPKNGQRAGLNWSAEYNLSGAVAQLGERRLGRAEATGSSPVSSTPPDSSPKTVGAHQFRNHFGWYMERTVAGEEFVVTRRGKPAVRLVPADAVTTRAQTKLAAA
jgi:prevent-host-death family protein